MQTNPRSVAPSEDMRPNIYAALLLTSALAVLAVSLRFLARRISRAPLGIDDWLVLAALVLTFGFDMNVFFLVRHGVGQHVQDVDLDATDLYRDFFLGLWIAELFYSFALTPTKLSFLAFYLRIFKNSTITRPIAIVAVAILCWCVARVIVTICHCVPVQGYWDKTIPSTCNVDDQKFFVGTVIPHLFMDLAILGIPLPYIQSLQISLYQKICVFSMFLLGGFICFATVIQVVVCSKLDATSLDVTWNFAPIALWATIEVNLAVVGVCLPSLRPVYLMIVKRSCRNLRSTPTNTHQSANWSSQLRTQPLSARRGSLSESTKQLADTEGGIIALDSL